MLGPHELSIDNGLKSAQNLHKPREKQEEEQRVMNRPGEYKSHKFLVIGD